jgi:hypothetical protein
MRPYRKLATLSLLALASVSFAQLNVPVYESNPGATYTLFLDFAGIDYRNVVNVYNGQQHTGEWGQTGAKPGIVPAYDTDGNASSFSSGEKAAIRDTWARFANAYAGFNINVTTVDPGQGLTGAQRQALYDQKRYFMHTQFGGTYNWFGASGGVSYVGTAQSANVASGFHTNWVFPVNGSGTSAQGMAAAGIHEDGHGLSLNHQRDEANGGGYSNNNGASGNGSYAPIMGTTYTSQRGTWRVGSRYGNLNDVATLLSNTNMGPLLDDGIGHTFGTASALTLNPNGTIKSATAKGWIMPKASRGYSAGNAVGDSDAYTKDYSRFSVGGGPVVLTVNDGNSLLQEGVADPGATMRSVLRILDPLGNLVGVGLESASTLKHTYSGSLAAGEYVAEISSYGAYISSYEPGARYFNMGAYFLTGSGFATVPEPATLVALGLGALILRRRKRPTTV